MPSTTLRNGKRFAVEPEATILDAALGQGVFLEYSCRTGRCGVCRTRVADGTTAAIRQEESLASDDLSAGWILTCCRTALDDVTLDAVDLGRLAGLRPRTVPARIAAIDPQSSTIRRVTLRFPPNTPLDFLPGQYLDVMARGVRRSYSIANAPRENRTIDLDIRRFEGGALSAYWFGDAAIGDLVRVELPLGTFFLREEPVATIVFLATGTGIAPVRAMLEEVAAHPAAAGDASVAVYWGNRAEEDFYWTPPDGLSVSFHRVLSRPTSGWSGRTGYVQDAVIADGIELSAAMVYACGSQAMIEAAAHSFRARGLPDHRFQFDAFVSSASVE